MPVGGFVSSDLSKIESNEVINDDRHSDAMHYTKRRLRDAIEAQEMLEKAFKDYTKGIDPVWVRTMSLLVGHENLQFRFVDSKTNPRKVDPDFVYDDATELFTAPKAILQHMTIGISEIKGSHAVSEYKFWDLPAYTSPPLGDFGSSTCTPNVASLLRPASLSCPKNRTTWTKAAIITFWSVY